MPVQTYAEIVTPGLRKTHIKDFIPDATLLTNLTAAGTAPMAIGEWYELDTTDATGRTVKKGAANPGALMSFMCMAEANRTDIQAMQLIPVIWDVGMEIRTTLITTAGLTIGDYLEVNDFVHADGNTYRGLQAFTTGMKVGIYLGLDADGYGHVRLIDPIV
jgi:hypothetical protein